jgi:hypothetical protein
MRILNLTHLSVSVLTLCKTKFEEDSTVVNCFSKRPSFIRTEENTMDIVQTHFNWAMNAASWNVFFECKLECCDMRAETWIVDPEGAATAWEWPINMFLK